MTDTQDPNVKPQRTRRNVIRMGTILATTAATSLATAKPADASVLSDLIKYLLGLANSKNNSSASGVGNRCLLRGTCVTTADGERKVEDLAIGDLLPTMFGGMQPIRWIDRYPLNKTDPGKSWPENLRPIRIARSALGPNLPRNDLYVSPWHSLFVEGVLAPAALLVNGATITVSDAAEDDEMEYFHIKLDSHDVIYAEGLPVETMLKADPRAANFDEYVRLYGPPDDNATPCAPVLAYGGRAELKSRARSALSPWIDRRQPLDVIRDRLEENGFALSQGRLAA